MTYLSAVSGELVPKALALDPAERILVAVAVPIEFMTKALRPVAVLEASAGVGLRRSSATIVSRATAESRKTRDDESSSCR